jgi:mannose-6-phosphate isomerase-like protein (cupin superfamily)
MAAPDHVVNLTDEFSQFDELWSPRIVAESNDWHLKIGRVAGEFVWHQHDDVDELFLVMEGGLTIRLQDRDDVHLAAGDVFVVPKGTEHQPVADDTCCIALLEPFGVQNPSETQNHLTAQDAWLLPALLPERSLRSGVPAAAGCSDGPSTDADCDAVRERPLASSAARTTAILG